MRWNRFGWVAAVVVLAFGVGSSALGQSSRQMKLTGLINDFTPASVGGPWEVRGEWSLRINGDSGKASFQAVLTMERSDQGVILNGGGDFDSPAARHAHVHHITLTNGTVAPLANGFRITGTAKVAGNGNPPPDFGIESPVQIDVTGGTLVPLSNLKLTFGAPASGHFGPNGFNGVVGDAN
jgi:hypothetical protein